MRCFSTLFLELWAKLKRQTVQGLYIGILVYILFFRFYSRRVNLLYWWTSTYKVRIRRAIVSNFMHLLIYNVSIDFMLLFCSLYLSVFCLSPAFQFYLFFWIAFLGIASFKWCDKFQTKNNMMSLWHWISFLNMKQFDIKSLTISQRIRPIWQNTLELYLALEKHVKWKTS